MINFFSLEYAELSTAKSADIRLVIKKTAVKDNG